MTINILTNGRFWNWLDAISIGRRGPPHEDAYIAGAMIDLLDKLDLEERK